MWLEFAVLLPMFTGSHVDAVAVVTDADELFHNKTQQSLLKTVRPRMLLQEEKQT